MACAVAVALPAPAEARGGRVHRLLPAHFMFGLANGSRELPWLRSARVPLEMRYQDNRAEYLLESRDHIADYVRAGAVAVLFGAGAAGTTHYDDRQRDGITNPPPINGNNLISRHPDDDGGYLRLAIPRYYQRGPVAVPR